MTTPVAGVSEVRHPTTPGATLVEQLRWQIPEAHVYKTATKDLLALAADEIESLRKRLSDTPTWIACAEQLPKRRYVEEPGFPGISINCLVVDADGDFDVAAYDLEDANWYSLQRATFLSGITHWMPLPEAPK